MIHHHAIAFSDADGIWVNSFIARWVDELTNHFDKVGLLLYESAEKKSSQDTCIRNRKVSLESLGPEGRMWDRIPRIKRTKKRCRDLTGEYDTLLVRGMTPRQMTIWKNVDVAHKWFLLVQNLKPYSQYVPRLSLSELYYRFMARYRLWELMAISKTGSMMANSHNAVRQVKATLSRDCIHVPTNTISANDFPGLEHRKLHREVSLLFCGRLTTEKGILEALQAISILNARDVRCRLNLVGAAVGKFGAAIAERVKGLGIEDQVRLHGSIPFGPALFDFYRKCDIFILPTYAEGFPHVIWEAAANCCPIIATEVGGIPALIENRKHGILIPPRDAQALADSVAELVADSELRLRIVSNAHRLAQDYTVESCARKLSDAIQ